MPGFLSSVGDIVKGSSSQAGHLYNVRFGCTINVTDSKSISDSVRMYINMIITEPIDSSLTPNQKSAFLLKYINDNFDKLQYCGGAVSNTDNNSYQTWINLTWISAGNNDAQINIQAQGLIFDFLNASLVPVFSGDTVTSLSVDSCVQIV